MNNMSLIKLRSVVEKDKIILYKWFNNLITLILKSKQKNFYKKSFSMV